MNEKKQTFMNYKSSDETVTDWEQLMAMVLSAENKARLCGAFVVLGQLEQLKKTITHNNSNKKVLRSVRTKLEKLESEIVEKQR